MARWDGLHGGSVGYPYESEVDWCPTVLQIEGLRCE